MLYEVITICIGQAESDEARIVEAAEKAAFHQVAEGFQEGYATMVGERGVTSYNFV